MKLGKFAPQQRFGDFLNNDLEYVIFCDQQELVEGDRMMNTEDAVKTAIGFFVIILVGALLSSFIGGAFGALVAAISPEFVTGLFSHKDEAGIVRYAFAVGMIWGVFIGAAVSGFACFLAAIVKILRIRFEYNKAQEAGNSPNKSA
jgi:hypothetical protein